MYPDAFLQPEASSSSHRASFGPEPPPPASPGPATIEGYSADELPRLPEDPLDLTWDDILNIPIPSGAVDAGADGPQAAGGEGEAQHASAAPHMSDSVSIDDDFIDQLMSAYLEAAGGTGGGAAASGAGPAADSDGVEDGGGSGGEGDLDEAAMQRLQVRKGLG
jgi:hypothetical protein